MTGMVRLITREKIPRDAWKKLPAEERNLLKKRPLTLEALREGRKAVFSKYHYEDTLIRKPDYKPDPIVDSILRQCGEEYATRHILRAVKNPKRRRLYLLGLVLCAGEKIAKIKEKERTMKLKELYSRGVLGS